MAKFYDQTEYPLTDELVGDEYFIIHKEDTCRTTNFSSIVGSILSTLLSEMSISELSDVTITNISRGDVLIYSGDVWVNNKIVLESINELQDVTTVTPSKGQILVVNDDLWSNSNSLLLKGYKETETNLGMHSGTYSIDLSLGNVQRLQITGGLDITLPPLPEDGYSWTLVLKVLFDGSNIPTFSSDDGELIWYKRISPTDMGENGDLTIFRFTSDVSSSQVYGTFDLIESI